MRSKVRNFRATLKFRLWPPRLAFICTRDPSPALICGDCGYNTGVVGGDYYMVLNELWNEFGNGKGVLCLICLERRIGTMLTINDFTHAPINNLIRFGYSLRKGSTAPMDAITDNLIQECALRVSCIVNDFERRCPNGDAMLALHLFVTMARFASLCGASLGFDNEAVTEDSVETAARHIFEEMLPSLRRAATK